MDRTPRLLVAVLGLVPLCAQQGAKKAPDGAPRPRFTLAAGRHDVADLVRMVEQARGAPIDLDAALLEQATDRDVVLQRELQLDPQEWEDVATVLLHSRGLWLTHDDAGRLSVHTPASWAQQGGDPSERTPAEVLARPYRTEVVRTSYRSQTDPQLLANSMRPLFVPLRDRIGVSLRADGEQVVCEGVTSHVVLALRILLAADGGEVADAPAPQWPAGKTCAWPGGALALGELLDLTARELDANVVRSDATMPKVRLDLGKAAQLAPRAFFAAAARALREHDVVLTVVHSPQRLFEALALADPAARADLLWRASVLPPAALADPELPIQPVITVVPMASDAVATAARKIRGLAAGEASLMIGSCPAGMVLAGMSDTVGAIVRDVAPAKQPRRR